MARNCGHVKEELVFCIDEEERGREKERKSRSEGSVDGGKRT